MSLNHNGKGQAPKRAGNASQLAELRFADIDGNNFGTFRQQLALSYVAAFALWPWKEIMTEGDATRILVDYIAKPGNIFRAGLNRIGHVVGATVSYPLNLIPEIQEYQRTQAEVAAYIAEVWVEPTFHRMGYGAALLADAEQQLQTAGNTLTMLRTAAIDRGLQRFYSDRGYVSVGLQPGDPNRRRVFEKPLVVVSGGGG